MTCKSCCQDHGHREGCPRGSAPAYVRVTGGDHAGDVLCLPCAEAEVRDEGDREAIPLYLGDMHCCDCCGVQWTVGHVPALAPSRVTISIDTDNAAFVDAGWRTEVARILRALACSLESGREMSRTVRDINGNRVGEVTFE